MKAEDIRLFICVPAVGKSYLEEIDERFVDMDRLRSLYKHGYPENISNDEIEKIKSNGWKSVASEDEVVEYIRKKMHEKLADGKYLLFAPHPNIVEMINQEGIPYCLVFSSLDSIEILTNRMRARGNNEKFVEEMAKVAYEKYDEHKNDPRSAFKIELKKDEYLSDVIYDFLGIN